MLYSFRGMRFITPRYGHPGRLGERSPAMVQILKNMTPGKSDFGKLSFSDNQNVKTKVILF